MRRKKEKKFLIWKWKKVVEPERRWGEGEEERGKER